ncbi:MAG: FHA domain-containing protein [candidate division KSB1 bacterium]|nr:FHA domain-containing protein [candidate division KSB1 bacterium]MDZ7274572.1 FHA domain-containing protein [candidate division KSB1 bacterium]MDZ7284767.1 FHA domain-containing protein [candidate division KSB1 bacterium]MDZ7297813.1 FHA domain-containing protein [candidate division KSB1 bacterium]MDZ7307777.1 FHA domain-containing protein [candidate division KSB1 bacterium]
MPLRDDERTVLTTPRALLVRLEKGELRHGRERWTTGLTLGRSAACEISFVNPEVSLRHAQINFEAGRWWLSDLNSTNGTFLNGRRIDRAALPAHAEVELGRNGPRLHLELEPLGAAGEQPPAAPPSLTQIGRRYFTLSLPGKIGEHTLLIRQAFQRVRRQHARRYWTIIGVIATLLLATSTALYHQSVRLKRLEQLHARAESMFYAMKALELEIARLAPPAAARPGAELRRLQQDYSDFVAEALGITPDKLPPQDWLIYKIVRDFGECDGSMPAAFKQTVHAYIAKWQSTPRLRQALARARQMGYPARIRKIMRQHGLPPQFFYLALQESDFDVTRCGPETVYGIAKGMWQFLPATARDYGLRVGPLQGYPEFDPQDERHDFEKATVAAAKHLRLLYDTKAQASGLLVMASYNWGQGNVLARIERMPNNPRERNFWRLLTTEKIPAETRDYVFYIIAAAVIGENPQLFGFDFPNPLRED